MGYVGYGSGACAVGGFRGYGVGDLGWYGLLAGGIWRCEFDLSPFCATAPSVILESVGNVCRCQNLPRFRVHRSDS